MAYAEMTDLEVRFPRALTVAETDLADPFMLDDATFFLATKVPGLEDAIDAGNEKVAHGAMLITVAMVKRALLAQAAQQQRDPSIDQIGQTYGPYSQNIKYRSDSGNLWLTNGEFDYLSGLVVGDTSAAVSMRSPGF